MKRLRIGLLLGAATALLLVVATPSGALACDGMSKAAKAEAAVAYGSCGQDSAVEADSGAKAATAAKAKPPKVFDKAPAVGTKATCPVTGNVFVVKPDTPRSVYKGKHVVFCCPACKPKFDADPQKYL